MFYVKGVGYRNGSFVKDGVSYPHNWTSLASQEERDSVGVVDYPIFDAKVSKVMCTGDDNSPFQTVPLSLEEEKELFDIEVQSALKSIDAVSGGARSPLLTTSLGQEFVYVKKAAEALRFIKGEVGDFPFLDAEATATGTTVADLATYIVDRALEVDTALAAIEAVRMKYKTLVKSSNTIAEVLNIKEQFNEEIKGVVQ